MFLSSRHFLCHLSCPSANVTWTIFHQKAGSLPPPLETEGVQPREIRPRIAKMIIKEFLKGIWPQSKKYRLLEFKSEKGVFWTEASSTDFLKQHAPFQLCTMILFIRIRLTQVRRSACQGPSGSPRRCVWNQLSLLCQQQPGEFRSGPTGVWFSAWTLPVQQEWRHHSWFVFPNQRPYTPGRPPWPWQHATEAHSAIFCCHH